MISVVVLQNTMDLLNSEPGSSNKTRVTSTVGGKEVTGIETERVSDISEVADQETTTVPAIKTEPNVSCVPVVLSSRDVNVIRRVSFVVEIMKIHGCAQIKKS